MKCIKNPNKNVVVRDCEECLTNRTASPVCFQRGFIWGVPDEQEPRWEFTKEEAENINEDVSMYFDLEWEGNTHLNLPKNTPQKIIRSTGFVPPEIRWAVWERDDFTCQICEKENSYQ